MYVVPFSIIIICTLLIVKKLFVREISTNNQLARSAHRNRRISLMLLFMCLTYIVCTLPNRLCFSVFRDQIVGHDYTDTIFLGSNTLMYARSAIDILFLYISVQGFRRDIHNLVLKCLRKEPRQIETTQRTLHTHQTQQMTMKTINTQTKTISVRQI